MSTASKIHDEIILTHCEANRPVFELWMRICGMHQSRDGSLHNQAWLELFSTRNCTDESYSEFGARAAGLWAKIDRLTPITQTREQRGAELTLLAILFALPFDDQVHQSLTAQPNLTLEQAIDCSRFLTYVPIYPENFADAYEDEDVEVQPVESGTSEVLYR